MALSSAIGFPLPFTITLCGPATNVSLTICGYIAWGDQLKRDAELRRKLLHYATFSTIQIMLIIVYPVFAYAFIGADIIAQTFLACVLPMIKLFMKAWLAKYMADSPDLRPQFLMFNVEVFHALFVACCMQNASSIATTCVIMALDAFHSWRNVRDVTKTMKKLEARLGRDHASALGFDLVGCTTYVLRDRTVFAELDALQKQSLTYPRLRNSAVRSVAQITPISVVPGAEMKSLHAVSTDTADLVTTLPCKLDAATMARLDNLPSAEKVEFAKEALGLLHLTEHVVLAEYIEVVVPVIYVLYLVTVFQLPNRRFYPQLRSMTYESHIKAITSVLAYASLELLSFVVLDVQLRRKLHFPPLRQLAFVLDHHWWLLPAKLLLWVTVVVQCTLEHFGADYSFQFVWLRKSP